MSTLFTLTYHLQLFPSAGRAFRNNSHDSNNCSTSFFHFFHHNFLLPTTDIPGRAGEHSLHFSYHPRVFPSAGRRFDNISRSSNHYFTSFFDPFSHHFLLPLTTSSPQHCCSSSSTKITFVCSLLPATTSRIRAALQISPFTSFFYLFPHNSLLPLTTSSLHHNSSSSSAIQ